MLNGLAEQESQSLTMNLKCGEYTLKEAKTVTVNLSTITHYQK